jgi:hypothetical protein
LAGLNPPGTINRHFPIALASIIEFPDKLTVFDGNDLAQFSAQKFNV